MFPGLLAERADASCELGKSEAVGSGGQGNDRFDDPAHARLVEIDAADRDLADTRCRRQTLKCLVGNEARVDAAERIGKALQHSAQSADDLAEVFQRATAAQL